MAFSLCITWAECNEGFDRVFTFNKIINLYYQRPSSEMCVQVDFGIIENDNDEKQQQQQRKRNNRETHFALNRRYCVLPLMLLYGKLLDEK